MQFDTGGRHGADQSAFGFFALLALAWAISENRRAVPWRIVISGMILMVVMAALLLKVPLFKQFFFSLNDGLMALEKATQAGTSFVFGYLGGGKPPFIEQPQTSSFVLAFRALPLILVVSALSSLLFYWRAAVHRAFYFGGARKTMGRGAVGFPLRPTFLSVMVKRHC